MYTIGLCSNDKDYTIDVEENERYRNAKRLSNAKKCFTQRERFEDITIDPEIIWEISKKLEKDKTKRKDVLRLERLKRNIILKNAKRKRTKDYEIIEETESLLDFHHKIGHPGPRMTIQLAEKQGHNVKRNT